MRWVLLALAVVGLAVWIGVAGFATAVAFVTGALASLAVFFAVGSFPFWLALALAVGVAWFIEESEEDGVWAIVPFVVFCLFVHFVSRFNLLDWGKENLHYIFTRTWQYLGLGFAYALARWVIHVQKKANEIDELEKQFRKETPFSGPLEAAAISIRVKFAEFLRYKYEPNLPGVGRGSYNPTEDGVVPAFGPNAFVWFRWFWWWPFSLLGYALNDLFRELWIRIKRGMRKIADGVSGWIFGKRAGYVLTTAQAEEARRAQHQPTQQQAAAASPEDDEAGALSRI